MKVKVRKHLRKGKNKVSVVKQHMKKKKTYKNTLGSMSIMDRVNENHTNQNTTSKGITKNKGKHSPYSINKVLSIKRQNRANKPKKSRSHLISAGAKSFLSKGGKLARQTRMKGPSKEISSIKRAAKKHLGFSVDKKKAPTRKKPNSSSKKKTRR